MSTIVETLNTALQRLKETAQNNGQDNNEASQRHADNQQNNLEDNSWRLDAEILLAHALQKTRSYLYAYPELNLNQEQQTLFSNLLGRRLLGVPIAYIIQQQEFWSLDFFVNSDVLIPRADTELLVETALDLIEILRASTNNAAANSSDTDLAALKNSEHNNKLNIVDAGTGSGAIVTALALETLNKSHQQNRACEFKFFALDRSMKALQVAARNIKQHKVEDRVQLLQSSWLEALADQSVDLLLSNPPYIDAQDHHLHQGDVRFEPISALVADDHGLSDIQLLAAQAQRVLKAGGFIAIEHGWQQAAQVRQIFECFNFVNCKNLQDLSGHLRVTLGQKIA